MPQARLDRVGDAGELVAIVRDEVLVRMPVAGVPVGDGLVDPPRGNLGAREGERPRSFMVAGIAWRRRRASRNAASPS